MKTMHLLLCFCMLFPTYAQKCIKIPTGYQRLIFHDEFNGEGLPDKTKWSYEEGHKRNREMQYYMSERLENSYVKDGCLHLVCRNDSLIINNKTESVTSASLHTRHTFNFKYGRVEMRAKLPWCLGTWPAIWLMPVSSVYGQWPKSGEIDIMEHVGYEPEKIHYAAHTHDTKTSKTGIGSNVFCPTACSDFHVYALEWHEDRLEWYLDGHKRYVTKRPKDAIWTSWPFDQEFYLILNLAFGGGWGGLKGVATEELPQEYIIDYVRIFQ